MLNYDSHLSTPQTPPRRLLWRQLDFSKHESTLADITWQQATTKIHSLNTIAVLVYHSNYYVSAILHVLEGEPLTSKDVYSFDHPSIQSAED